MAIWSMESGFRRLRGHRWIPMLSEVLRRELGLQQAVPTPALAAGWKTTSGSAAEILLGPGHAQAEPTATCSSWKPSGHRGAPAASRVKAPSGSGPPRRPRRSPRAGVEPTNNLVELALRPGGWRGRSRTAPETNGEARRSRRSWACSAPGVHPRRGQRQRGVEPILALVEVLASGCVRDPPIEACAAISHASVPASAQAARLPVALGR